MRKLFPTDEDTTKLSPMQKWHISKEDWDELLNKLSELAGDLREHISDFEDFKNAIREEFTSAIINATRANIDTADVESLVSEIISSKDVISESATIDQLTVNINANIQRLGADYARFQEAVISRGTIDELTSTNASFTTVTATQAEIDNYDITNLSATDADVTNLSAHQADLEMANVDDLISDNLIAADAQIKNIEAQNVATDKADITQLEYEFAINDDDAYQDITTAADPDGYVYVQLPPFENGVYYLHGVDTSNNDKLFTVELFNSIENRFLRWSDSDAHYLVECYNEIPRFVLKLNTRGKAIRLYHRADTRATIEPPTILSEYIEPSVTDNTYYQIKYKDGNKVWKPFDLMGDGSAVGILTLDQTNDFDEVKAQDQTQYDTSSDVTRNYYIPNQDVNKEAQVKFDNVQIGPTEEDDDGEMVFTKNAEIDNEGNISNEGYYKNKRLFVGALADYDASEMINGGIVITEGLLGD